MKMLNVLQLYWQCFFQNSTSQAMLQANKNEVTHELKAGFKEVQLSIKVEKHSAHFV